MHHLAWPAAHGLFQRAVVMSGGGRTYGIGVAAARAEQSGVAFARSMGITGTGADALTALRALPVEKVNGDLSMEASITKPETYAGGPIVDQKIVTDMRVLFTDILDFCARVLAIQFGKARSIANGDRIWETVLGPLLMGRAWSGSLGD
ncbi:MAG: hypothetical protein ACRD15_06900, partial [Vicinamibacterales bacterium]